MSRTFPFPRGGAAARDVRLARGTGGVPPPHPGDTGRPDLRRPADQAVTDRDAAADLWHSPTGSCAPSTTCAAASTLRAADHDNARRRSWAAHRCPRRHRGRKAGRQTYLDRANEHYARRRAEETDPEAARAEREAGDADMQQADSPDYYFDPSAERAFRSLPGAQRAFDQAQATITWVEQHEVRTRDDAVALGELAPAISDAASRWPELDRVAAELARRWPS